MGAVAEFISKDKIKRVVKDRLVREVIDFDDVKTDIEREEVFKHTLDVILQSLFDSGLINGCPRATHVALKYIVNHLDKGGWDAAMFSHLDLDE